LKKEFAGCGNYRIFNSHYFTKNQKHLKERKNMKLARVKQGIIAVTLFTMAFLPTVAVRGATTDNKSAALELQKTFMDVVKKMKPSVVDISTETTITRQGQQFGIPDDPFFRQFFGENPMFQAPPQRQQLQTRGSGFIIRKDGYILTNNHVVKNREVELGKITVTLSDGRTKDAKIIGTDENSDLAVIKIDGDNYPVAELGDSDTIEVGQLVFTFGSPFSFSGSVSQGIISGLGRELGLSQYEHLIQTDAAMNPGNSGGPLVDIFGNVIGINKAIATGGGGQGMAQSAGIGFAIPINLARSVMGDLIKSGKWVRGYLGIFMGDVSEDLAKQMSLPNTKGVLVTQVIAKSPAASAGIQEYDVITEFNGKPVESPTDLKSMVALTHVGDKVPVKLIRDGKEKIIMVTVTERTETEEAALIGKDTFKKWGLTLKTLTADLAKQSGIDLGNGGLLITDVDADSSAADMDFQKGDVILEVDKKPVKDIKDITAIIADKKAGDKILFRAKSPQGGYKIILFTVPGAK
jgi:serine protease Do